MTFKSGAVTRQALGENSGISFDAASNTYTVSYVPAGGPGDPTAIRTLAYAPGDVSSNAGNFTTFQHGDPGDAAYTDRLRVSKLGAANAQIALTYTQFAVQEIANGTDFLERDYIVFGSRTATLPTSGTATYNGIVDGTYYRASGAQTYLISGTSTLTADFGAGTIGTAINFTGTNSVAGQPGLSAQAFNGIGQIAAGGTNNSQFYGTMTGMGLPGGASLIGNFYGGAAEEFGYAFFYVSASDRFAGIAVGKK